jgi:polysaccharide biosynthesis transport protein
MNAVRHVAPISHDNVSRLAPVLERHDDESELRRTLDVFLRRKRLIMTTASAVLLMMIAFIWITKPLYSSVAEILIDPRNKRTLDSEIAPTGLGSSALGGDTLLLDSQIEVIRSQSVIKRIVEVERLMSDPEFGGSDLWAPLALAQEFFGSMAYGPRGFGIAPLSPYDKAVKKLNKRLKVERKRNTYVVEISTLSENPEKAARIANRIVEFYVSENSSAAASSTLETAATLQSRLDQLRATAETAAQKVETYRRENGLIGTQDLLVVEQQLRDVNDELSKARVEKEGALARLRQVQLAMAAGTPLQPAAIDLVESPVLAQLQVRMAEVEARQAELRATVLSRHPSYTEITENKAALKTSIAAEYKRIVDRLGAVHKAAIEKERALELQVGALETRTAQSNAASVRLRELERDAQASRSVYETYLKRSKEAWEQVDLPHSTARIISKAYPSSRPAYPQVPLLLLAAAALGLILGLALAWLMHLLQGTARPVTIRDRWAQASEPAQYRPVS